MRADEGRTRRKASSKKKSSAAREKTFRAQRLSLPIRRNRLPILRVRHRFIETTVADLAVALWMQDSLASWMLPESVMTTAAQHDAGRAMFSASSVLLLE